MFIFTGVSYFEMLRFFTYFTAILVFLHVKKKSTVA